MSESEFKTDVASCYMVNCANNDAMTCGLLRITITADGVCGNFENIIEEQSTTTTD